MWLFFLPLLLIICCSSKSIQDDYNYPRKANAHAQIHITDNNFDKILQQMVLYTSSPTSDLSFPVDPSMIKALAQKILVKNKAMCVALNLSSNACYHDCIHYLDPLSLVALNRSEQGEFRKILSWYSFSGGPISYFDVGNPDMCQYAEGTYCYTPIMSSSQVLMEHGCCLPGTCTGEDAIKILKNNTYCYQAYNLTYNTYMFKGMGDIKINCDPLPRDFKSFGAIFVILIFFIFVVLVIIASIITQYNKQQEPQQNSLSFPTEPKRSHSIYLEAYLHCFSLHYIWNYFVSRRPLNKSEFNFLDGIRVGSMSWVIYGHAFVFFASTGVSNLSTFFPMGPTASDSYDYIIGKFYMMIAEYAFYSVDSFFWLSGFLATFSISRLLTKYGDKSKAIKSFYIWIPMVYLGRILRIVPMMMFVTAVQWQLSDQLPSGYHLASRDEYNTSCTNDWYKILFFYANLEITNGNEASLGCMGHLWYIQCDMQMFLLLPWLVLIFHWKKIYGLIASLIPILGCIAVRIYFAIYYEYSANLLYPSFPTKHDGNQMMSYFKPYTRCSVYFIAVFTMFLILTLQNINKSPRYTFSISESTYFVLMNIAGFALMSLIFWPYQDVDDTPQNRWSLLSNQIYYTLGRPTWGISLSLIAFAFVFKNTSNNKTSIIKTILSAEIWQPISKLTYTMYLIHLLIFMWFIGDLSMPTYYSYWYVFFVFCGVWFISFAITLILFLTMEQPMANMVRLFLKWLSNTQKNRKQNLNSTRSVNIQNEYKSKSLNLSLLPDGRYIDTEDMEDVNLNQEYQNPTVAKDVTLLD